MLKVNKIAKSFLNLEVLKDISFNVKKGQFVSIIGPNGCGKTVLLKIIAGIERSYTGKVRLQEEANPIILWQDYRLFPWKTVFENVMFPLGEQDKNKKEECVDQLLNYVGLNEFKNYYLHQLSGGMQQKVALARALITEPKILLLDEPFSNIEWYKTQEFYQNLKKIQQQKKLTVLQVTHDIPNAVKYSDKIIVLSHRPTRVKAVFSDVKEKSRIQRRILNSLKKDDDFYLK